eukprot:5908553-Prymnesium_polylepis.1
MVHPSLIWCADDRLGLAPLGRLLRLLVCAPARPPLVRAAPLLHLPPRYGARCPPPEYGMPLPNMARPSLPSPTPVRRGDSTLGCRVHTAVEIRQARSSDPCATALILSVLGQLLIHAGCMYWALGVAKAHMGDSAVKE